MFGTFPIQWHLIASLREGLTKLRKMLNIGAPLSDPIQKFKLILSNLPDSNLKNQGNLK